MSDTAVLNKLLAMLKEPTLEMIEAGVTALDDCVDHDWDSDCDGNRYDYTTIRSDAASIVFKAMVGVALNQLAKAPAE